MNPKPVSTIDRQLRYFLAVADDLSITRAAERLALSQPALSQQISGLEENLGHKLFHRTGHGLALTPVGARLAETIAAGYESVDKAVASLFGSTETERISIASVHSLASTLIPPAAKATRNSHCDLRIELTCTAGSEVVDKVARNQVDVGLVHGTLVADSGLESIPLFSDKLVFAFSRDLAEAWSIDKSADLPVNIPVIAFPAGYALRRLADRFFGHRTPHIVVEVGSLDAMLAFCSAGIGVCFLPETLIRHRPEAANLLKKVPSGSRFQTTAIVVRSRTRPIRPAADTFIKSILRVAQEMRRPE